MAASSWPTHSASPRVWSRPLGRSPSHGRVSCLLRSGVRTRAASTVHPRPASRPKRAFRAGARSMSCPAAGARATEACSSAAGRVSGHRSLSCSCCTSVRIRARTHPLVENCRSYRTSIWANLVPDGYRAGAGRSQEKADGHEARTPKSSRPGRAWRPSQLGSKPWLQLRQSASLQPLPLA